MPRLSSGRSKCRQIRFSCLCVFLVALTTSLIFGFTYIISISQYEEKINGIYIKAETWKSKDFLEAWGGDNFPLNNRIHARLHYAHTENQECSLLYWGESWNNEKSAQSFIEKSNLINMGKVVRIFAKSGHDGSCMSYDEKNYKQSTGIVILSVSSGVLVLLLLYVGFHSYTEYDLCCEVCLFCERKESSGDMISTESEEAGRTDEEQPVQELSHHQLLNSFTKHDGVKEKQRSQHLTDIISSQHPSFSSRYTATTTARTPPSNTNGEAALKSVLNGSFRHTSAKNEAFSAPMIATATPLTLAAKLSQMVSDRSVCELFIDMSSLPSVSDLSDSLSSNSHLSSSKSSSDEDTSSADSHSTKPVKTLSDYVTHHEPNSLTRTNASEQVRSFCIDLSALEVDMMSLEGDEHSQSEAVDATLEAISGGNSDCGGAAAKGGEPHDENSVTGGGVYLGVDIMDDASLLSNHPDQVILVGGDTNIAEQMTSGGYQCTAIDLKDPGDDDCGVMVTTAVTTERSATSNRATRRHRYYQNIQFSSDEEKSSDSSDTPRVHESRVVSVRKVVKVATGSPQRAAGTVEISKRFQPRAMRGDSKRNS